MTAITPRGIEINLDAARPLDAKCVACDLLHTTRVLSLATLDPSGYPYGTVTNFALDYARAPIFFASGLSLHTRNIQKDPRISITVADHKTDVMTTPRLTLTGQAITVEGAEKEELKAIYLNHFPKAKLYLALPDAFIYRLNVEHVQLNGGPGQNANALTPADLAIDLSGADTLLAAAPELLEKLNDAGLSVKIADATESEKTRWKAVAIDPEGIDLASSDKQVRCWFPQRVNTPAEFAAAIAAASNG